MTASPIPDDIRRFVLTSVPSVPYIESLLLLRREAGSTWSPAQLASRLYVPEAQAAQLLEALVASGVATRLPDAPGAYGYGPAPHLDQLLDRLARHYAADLVGVTALIHSGLNKRANQFADAFRWRKDS